MKIEKIIKKEEELEITGATLLTVEEAEQLPERLRTYKDWWWLRLPGTLQNYAASVYNFGSVDYFGNSVNFDYVCVRPALTINLESSDFKVGDKFIFGDKIFEIVSPTRAFCLEDIGYHCFRRTWEANDANNYEKSDIKKYVDKWFKMNRKEK